MPAKRKGQLNIEFVASMLIFALLVTYVIVYIYDILPGFGRNSETEQLRASAFQLSELLVADPGEPADWSAASFVRPGLAVEGETHLIDYRKVEELGSIDYDDIKRSLDLNRNFTLVIRNASDDTVLLSISGGDPLEQAVNVFRVVPAIHEDGGKSRLQILLTLWSI